MTALFIASKNLEVEPLDLRTCVKELCYNKYSKQEFLKKEADIRLATNYENEAPTCLDFIMLYVRLIKMALENTIDCLPKTAEFIFDVQTIAYDYYKSIIIDASMLKYRPSVLAAACINLGFQLQFEIQMNKKPPTFELQTHKGKQAVC